MISTTKQRLSALAGSLLRLNYYPTQVHTKYFFPRLACSAELFQRRVWVKVLEKAGVRYRKPYGRYTEGQKQDRLKILTYFGRDFKKGRYEKAPAACESSCESRGLKRRIREDSL
uniref:Uncharacterized protein n=1 Tax=Citrifermentans bremense TaxID=60035 RepID=A0A6S6LYY3_9BACT